jgi:hypothetical protein
MRTIVALAYGFLAIFPGSALAQSAQDSIAGDWIAVWSKNNTNPLHLENKGGRLSGTYKNDKPDTCAVTGNFAALNRHLALTIVCPDWDIRMEGQLSSDGKTVKGAYQAYVDTHGEFTMARR